MDSTITWKHVTIFLLQYYVRGKITKSGQETFYNYAKRIGTLTLGQPDSKNSGAKKMISPQVFLRLGRLQGVDGSLLPSLHRLQICTSDASYLDHLDLFLSPSLKSLEISEIPTEVGHSSSIMSFLDNTAEVSPDLESLSLGPFELGPQKFLDSCVKFRQLRCLELCGVSLSITSVNTILSDIGSLEHLEKFVLEEDEDPPEKPAVLSEAAAAPVPGNTSGNTVPGLPASFYGLGISSLSPSIESKLQTPIKHPTSSSGFGLGSGPVDSGQPGTSRVVGSPVSEKQPHPSPIELPTPSTSTATLRSPVDSLGFGKPNIVNSSILDKQPHSSPIEPPISSSSGLRTNASDSWGTGTFMATNVVGSPVSERRPLMSNLFPSLKVLGIVGTSDLIEKVVSSVTSPDLCVLSFTFTTITSKMRTMKRKKKKTESTVFVLNNIIERWASLKSVAITADVSETVSLPNDILRDLLLQPDLKQLEINGFDIPSINSALPELVGEAYSSQLETLLLPASNGVPLSRLRHIAMAWPNLTSLRCKLRVDFANFKLVQPIMMDPISHKLESLIVASDDRSGPVQQQKSSRLLQIAAYIDCLFPDLAEMETVVDDFGQQHSQRESEPEWVQVFDMVKLLQTVRAHDRQRFRPQGLNMLNG